jgi:CheY-like chemotaxis protein
MTMPLQPTGGRILLLDDDPGVQQTLSTDLFSVGFEVICCADMPALLYQVGRATPRCILLDQETSGIGALNQLRYEGCTAPVLMISGRADISSARIGKSMIPGDTIGPHRRELQCKGSRQRFQRHWQRRRLPRSAAATRQDS